MGSGLAKTEAQGAPDAHPSGGLRLFVAGEGRFATHHLPDSGEVTIGRQPGCELHVDDPSCPSAAIEEILASSIRLVDVVAVGGPSDYEVMLVDTPPEDLKLVVSRLTTQLAERGGKPRIGMAIYPRDGRSADELLSHANGELAPRMPATEAAPAPGAMQDLYSMVERIAWSDISVLIFGETGVGKERLAEAVHKNSRRAPEALFRRELPPPPPNPPEGGEFAPHNGALPGAPAPQPGPP